jgi:hypothetical protein
MKTLSMLPLLTFFTFTSLFAVAQTEIPKGYSKGIVLLPDGSRLEGFVKESIRAKASVCFIATAQDKKKCYEGSDLQGVELDGEQYICIKGDFFKVISRGELDFLQKASDASGKPVYNGTEAVFSNGTEGKPGDYFIFHTQTSDLKLVNKKNATAVSVASFADCTAALEKAKNINGDITLLKDAVEAFNNRNK